MLTKSMALITLILTLSLGTASAGDDPWFFSAEAMANAYRHQRQFGPRQQRPLQPHDCYYGRGEFNALHRGEEFSIPCQFISETTRQLKQLLASGTAKYLFPLDVGYAALAVPAQVYAKKYKKLPPEQILPQLLREPTLVAVYRTAAHGNASRTLKITGENRAAPQVTVLGFYDGRPNQIDLQGKLNLVELGGFYMLEHFLGELTFIVDQRVVTLDISFETDRAEPTRNMSRAIVDPAGR